MARRPIPPAASAAAHATPPAAPAAAAHSTTPTTAHAPTSGGQGDWLKHLVGALGLDLLVATLISLASSKGKSTPAVSVPAMKAQWNTGASGQAQVLAQLGQLFGSIVDSWTQRDEGAFRVLIAAVSVLAAGPGSTCTVAQVMDLERFFAQELDEDQRRQYRSGFIPQAYGAKMEELARLAAMTDDATCTADQKRKNALTSAGTFDKSAFERTIEKSTANANRATAEIEASMKQPWWKLVIDSIIKPY